MTLDQSTLLSRRSLFAATIGGLAALAAEAIGRPVPTRAADPNDVLLGGYNSTTSQTSIEKTSVGGNAIGGYAHGNGAGLRGESEDGDGVRGYSSGAGNGVYGLAGAEGATSIYGLKGTTGTAVWGRIVNVTSGWGAVFGSTNGSGPGVIGENSGTGRGSWGRAFGTGDGIYGESTNGRGGRFQGKKAQIRLDPSTAATHPASGSAGDIFLDKSKRLWLCKGGTKWARLDL